LAGYYYSALNEIQAQTNKGKQIIVDPIKPSDASQANIEAKKSQFPKLKFEGELPFSSFPNEHPQVPLTSVQ
jgi:hypothetical protein